MLRLKIWEAVWDGIGKTPKSCCLRGAFFTAHPNLRVGKGLWGWGSGTASTVEDGEEWNSVCLQMFEQGECTHRYLLGGSSPALQLEQTAKQEPTARWPPSTTSGPKWTQWDPRAELSVLVQRRAQITTVVFGASWIAEIFHVEWVLNSYRWVMGIDFASKKKPTNQQKNTPNSYVSG